MRISKVRANNRRKAFEIQIGDQELSLPYAYSKLGARPSSGDRVAEVFADEELGLEAFTYRLESGAQDTVHMDVVLEYNRDPSYMNDLLLHRLTVEALQAIEENGLSKRELIRRLGTSPSQFYRLMDPTNYRKSMGQLVALLWVLGKDVDLVVRERKTASSRKNDRATV